MTDRSSILLEPEQFRPPWYLRNGHVQTILTGFYKPRPSLPQAIEHRIPLGENGHSLVFENAPEVKDPSFDDQAVLLLHGLGSSHAGTYMTTMARQLVDQGVRVFRADLPGAGTSGRLTPLPPHGACYQEVWQMLLHLRDKLGIRRWRISGVSLGGNILLKMLASRTEEIDSGTGTRELSVLRAVALAPPVRLSECSTHMERGVHRMYAQYFMGALRKQAKHRAEIWPKWAEQMKHASFETIRKFDETVTAPMAGFRNAEEYYAMGSSFAWLDQIAVPTIILIDKHDPIVPAWMFDGARFSATTTFRTSEYGGHVGYLHRAASIAPGTAASARRSIHRWSDSWIVRELLR
jgi:predicted alpha/beta-fold hydrolase